MKFDNQTGIHDPVFLMIARRAVEQCDLMAALAQLRLLGATREDSWLYRGQLTLAFDGYDADSRELIEIPDVRAYVKALHAVWPHWSFFFNQLDPTINLWAACLCGDDFPGGGQVQIELRQLKAC